ncbi:hypothetical protein TNCV_287921 [Trichonephila clavipes]|nr:hypothetical protein TNCV_287921 [Trichonephila clavipes]
MSKIGECRHTPNTSMKDRILYIRTFTNVCRQSQICFGGGRKERNRQRGDWPFPAKSFVLLEVSQLYQSYARTSARLDTCTSVWSSILSPSNYHDMGKRVMIFCWTNRNPERKDHWGEAVA